VRQKKKIQDSKFKNCYRTVALFLCFKTKAFREYMPALLDLTAFFGLKKGRAQTFGEDALP